MWYVLLSLIACTSIIIISIIKYHETHQHRCMQKVHIQQIRINKYCQELYIKFRLLRAINMNRADFMNTLTTETFIVITKSGVR